MIHTISISQYRNNINLIYIYTCLNKSTVSSLQPYIIWHMVYIIIIIYYNIIIILY